MTTETRTTIELSDIGAIEIVCAKCKVRTVYPLDKFSVPLACGECGEAFAIAGSQEHKDLEKFVEFIERWDAAKKRFGLRLEVNNPSK